VSVAPAHRAGPLALSLGRQVELSPRGATSIRGGGPVRAWTSISAPLSEYRFPTTSTSPAGRGAPPVRPRRPGRARGTRTRSSSRSRTSTARGATDGTRGRPAVEPRGVRTTARGRAAGAQPLVPAATPVASTPAAVRRSPRRVRRFLGAFPGGTMGSSDTTGPTPVIPRDRPQGTTDRRRVVMRGSPPRTERRAGDHPPRAVSPASSRYESRVPAIVSLSAGSVP